MIDIGNCIIKIKRKKYYFDTDSDVNTPIGLVKYLVKNICVL